MIAYEEGNLEHDEIIDTGMAWKLQGHYGRTARSLIEKGIALLNKRKPDWLEKISLGTFDMGSGFLGQIFTSFLRGQIDLTLTNSKAAEHGFYVDSDDPEEYDPIYQILGSEWERQIKALRRIKK